jgi:hypothetical protein
MREVRVETVAAALQDELRQRGTDAFLDDPGIEVGQRFTEEIVDALLTARVVVVFADALYFERDMCRWELEIALAPSFLGGGSADHIVVAIPRDGPPRWFCLDCRLGFGRSTGPVRTIRQR